MPKSRSLRDLLSKILEQENASFSGDSGAPVLPTPDFGTPEVAQDLATDVVGGAVAGFKVLKSPAAAGVWQGFSKNKQDELELIEGLCR